MRSPLPTVKEACSILQQEESQRDVLQPENADSESFAMGHSADRCWTIIGYPKWHSKHKGGSQKKREKEMGQNSRWKNQEKGGKGKKVAVAASQRQGAKPENSGITLQKLEQLLRNMLSTGKNVNWTGGGSESDEDAECNFAGMVICNAAATMMKDWIVDLGASDHMTSDLAKLKNPVEAHNYPLIQLPNGKTSRITHVGSVRLNNDLELKNVLYGPDFKHNLISVNKLIKDDKCRVQFHPSMCTIQDEESEKIKEIGRVCNGLYYLINEDMKKIMSRLKLQGTKHSANLGEVGPGKHRLSKAMIWHLDVVMHQ
ncbi:Retrovirus-related Pol polyprotein from transposon RE2 [Bienertia sinuspersici]